MPIEELKEILQDQAHTFQDTTFKSSQINFLKIMYHIEHSNRDTCDIFHI